MSFLTKLFRQSPPPKRVHVCVECGMPVSEHKNWCSILRTRQEMDARAAAAKQAPSGAN